MSLCVHNIYLYTREGNMHGHRNLVCHVVLQEINAVWARSFGHDCAPETEKEGLDVLRGTRFAGRLIKLALLGPSVVPFYPCLGEGSPTKIDDRKKGTILTSLLSTGGPRLYPCRISSIHSISRFCSSRFFSEM